MIPVLYELEEVGDWNEICLILGNYLGLYQPVPDVVLKRAMQDDRFAGHLFMSKNRPHLLKLLFDDPKNSSYDHPEIGKNSDPEILSNGGPKLWELSEAANSNPEEKAYNKKYRPYFWISKMNSNTCKSPVEIKAHDFRETYLDHNATTYIRPEVSELLVDYYSGKYDFGNPSSNTVQGYYTHDIIRNARKEIADSLSSQPDEIYFTGCGSEANNLAIKGIAFNHLDTKGHLITSNIEHPSVLRVMEYLESIGYSVTYLDVDKYGMVTPESVKNAIQEDTILVSIMAANNEIGTINPIAKIGKICKEKNIPFMVDAIQAYGKIPLNPKEMGISLMSMSGHKIYAPKGIGALFVEKGISLVPQVHGGGQESGLRAGTENVGSILAFGKAAELAHKEMEKETQRLMELRNFFLDNLKEIEPGIIVNGSMEERLPNNLSIGFPGVDSMALLRSLNRIGVSVSTSSACSSKKVKTSHVLKAIGADTDHYGTIRFSFGLKTKKEDLEYIFQYLGRILSLIKE